MAEYLRSQILALLRNSVSGQMSCRDIARELNESHGDVYRELQLMTTANLVSWRQHREGGQRYWRRA